MDERDLADVKRPDERSLEQELASGRSAATPFAALASVMLVLAVVVLVVLAIAGIAYALA